MKSRSCKTKVNLLKIITFIFFITFSIQNVWAATRTFDGDTDNTWDLAANWSDNTKPGIGDVAVIPNTFTVLADDETVTIDSLRIDSGGALNFDDNGGSGAVTFTISGQFLNNGSVTTSSGDTYFPQHVMNIGGNFTGTGTFNGYNTDNGITMLSVNLNGTSTQSFNLTGSTLTFYRITISNTTAQVTTLNSNSTIINRFTVNDDADVVLGSGTISLEGGADFRVGTTGSPDVILDATTNNSTLLFIGSGTAALTIYDDQTFDNIILNKGSGTFTMNGNSSGDFEITGTLTRTNGLITLQNTILSYSGTSSTVAYNGSSAQTTGIEWTNSVNPANVTIINTSGVTLAGTADESSREISGNLTLTQGQLNHNASGDTLTVHGDITGGSGSYGVGANRGILELNGSSSTNITISESFTVGNLYVNKNSSSVSVTVHSGGVLKLDNGTGSANSDFNINQGTFLFSSSTQLSLQGTGNNHNFTVGTNGILQTGGVNISGFDNYNLSSGTIVFSGSATETLPTGVTIGTVEINNAANVQVGTGTLTISDSLVLTSGRITTTSSNILRLDASATIGGSPSSSNIVVGPLQKEFTSASTDSFVYAIGSGTDYRPAAFDYTAYTGTGTSIIEIQHATSFPTAKTKPTGIDEIDLTGHYIVRERGTAPSTFTYTFSGTFEDGNFNPEDRNNILVETGTTYIVGQDSLVDETNNVATGKLFVALPVGDFRIVFGSTEVTTFTWDGDTDNSWFEGTNWNPDGVPTSGDNVIINGAYTINIDEGAAMCSTLTVGDGTNLVTLTVESTNDSLYIYSAASSALTISNNSKLVLQADDVVRFDPDNTYAYDASKTEYRTQSMVEYGAGSDSVFVDTYGDLILNGATETTGSGTIIVEGDLKKPGSGTFTASNIITVNGDSLNFSAGVFIPTTMNFLGIDFQISGSALLFAGGSSTVFFGGNNAQTITDNSSNSLGFRNFTINKSSNNITLNDPIYVNGTLNLISGLIFTTDTNPLRIGSVSGGSSSSYIDGPVVCFGLGTKLFPTGNNGDYRPIELLNIVGTLPAIKFQMLANNPNGTAGTGLNNISNMRYWSGAVVSGSIDSAKVRLSWGSNDGVDGLLSDLRVARGTAGGTFTSLGNSATTGDGSSGTITSDSIHTIQDFTLGSLAGDNSLPVSLTSFTADAVFGRITLNWQTESEIDNQGFNIYRAAETNPENWIAINQELIPGAGNTSARTEYSFVDQTVQSGETYNYRLESISYNGVRELFIESTVTIVALMPNEFALLDNYPNPFNPVTKIKFQVPEKSEISMIIYDIQGHLVKKLLSNSTFEPGEHIVQWNATDNNNRKVSTGVYFYQFVSGNFQKIGKMMLIK